MNRIAVLFVASIAMTQVSTTAYAEELKTPQAMSAECEEVSKSGKVSKSGYRQCISTCSSIDKARNSSQAEMWLKRCKDYYEKVTRMYQQSVEIDRIAASTPTIIELADIEGVYLRSRHSRVQVRAEGRTDWQTHCNEMAGVIMPDNIKFFQTVRPNYRVRLVGVSYAPARVKDRAKGCLAKSAVVLEDN